MPRRASVPALTAPQALYILGKLIEERQVSAADIRRHLGGMWQEMTFVQRRLDELRGVAATVHPVRKVKAAVRRVIRRKLSPEVIASRKLQGQYLGYTRQIPKSERPRYSEIARTKGREAAVAALKKRLGK